MKGAKGALELCNVWIRWFIYKKQYENYHHGIDHPVDSVLASLKFDQDFIDDVFIAILYHYRFFLKFDKFFHFLRLNKFLVCFS